MPSAALLLQPLRLLLLASEVLLAATHAKVSHWIACDTGKMELNATHISESNSHSQQRFTAAAECC